MQYQEPRDLRILHAASRFLFRVAGILIVVIAFAAVVYAVAGK
jgi:hypothetical protein